MAKQFTFGKNERLKSRKQIEQLFSEGKKFGTTPYRIFYLFKIPLTTQHTSLHIQFGAGVSAKNFKKAADRNRIKRLTREAYRLQKNELKEKLIKSGKQMNIFFIYTAKEIPDFNLAKDKVAVALKKLVKLVDENPSADS